MFDGLRPAEAHSKACKAIGMTEASYEFVSGLSDSVYSDDSYE